MLQHLKTFTETYFENHPDHTSTRKSFIKSRRVNYNFLDSKLVIVQETSGKHIDALQLLPTFLQLGKFLSENSKETRNKLSESELDAMYEKIVQLFNDLPPDQDRLIVDKLVIPRRFATRFARLSDIQTNYTRRQNRASMWVMDLLLCALNNSVVRPHFKGNRGH
jgi:hypothetical protein